MSDEAEWGPWIEHDQLGIKPYGAGVISEIEYGFPTGKTVGRQIGVSKHPVGRARGWHSDDYHQCISWVVIRFRIRRPKRMAILNAIIADLPAPVAPIKTDGVIA